MTQDFSSFDSVIAGKRILAFVLAYNEEKTIRDVIENIRQSAPYADIVVIDDCSTDRTKQFAQEAGVPVISHLINSNNAGFSAVKTAITYAHLEGYDICCQVDGDGQHDASFLRHIIAPVADDRADYVIGSRFLKVQGYTSTLPRVIAITFFSWVTSLIIRQRVYDVTSGFKAMGKKIIGIFALYPHLIHDTNEMIILAKMNGSRILEVPVIMKRRRSGRSWYSVSKAILYPIKTLLVIIEVLVRRNNA